MINNSNLYNNILDDIIDRPEYKLFNTREVLNKSIKINPKQLMTSSRRLLSPYYLAGEVAFSLEFSRKLSFIRYYSEFWDNISDDGENVRSAYFWQILSGHGFNQFYKVYKQLSECPDTRQAVIHIHHADTAKYKDEICTLTIQFLIREGRLNMIVSMRSNDIVLGLPYDATVFSLLQSMLANSLKIQVGDYYHNAGSMHIYNKDLGKIRFSPVEVTEQPYKLDFDNNFLAEFSLLLKFEERLRLGNTIQNNWLESFETETAKAFTLIYLAKAEKDPNKRKEIILKYVDKIDHDLCRLLKNYEKL